MHHSSRLIPAMPKQILLAVFNPRPGEAKMELGRRKVLNPFSDTSCMIAQMKDFVWLEESRFQLPMSMIVKWIWPKKAKFDMLIKDILEPRQMDMMEP